LCLIYRDKKLSVSLCVFVRRFRKDYIAFFESAPVRTPVAMVATAAIKFNSEQRRGPLLARNKWSSSGPKCTSA
jgi:hypothetical protein